MQGVFKCKNCEASLNLSEAVNGVIRCNCCQSIFTVPKKEQNSDALNFLNIGELNLDAGKFDEAYLAFEKASQCDSKEPEAYWGMAISKAKVQYLKDYVNDRLQPICYEVSDKKITDDRNYNKALALATKEQKESYVQKAQEIDYIRAEFRSLKSQGLNYDCFLCVKVRDDQGKYTSDCNDANELYFHLKEKGYAPFFSEREIKNGKIGADYEALILYALYTSKCMLIICSNEDYLQTKWVKNEYSRFNSFVTDEKKERNSITFLFRKNPIEKLPGKNGKIEGIDLSKPDAYGKIEEYISSFRASSKHKIERKTYDTVIIKKKSSQREGVQKRTISIQEGVALSVSETAKLSVAKEFMSRRNYSSATKTLRNLLKENSSNGEAYLLYFFSELSCPDKETFLRTNFIIKSFDNFENALSLMDQAQRKELYDLLYTRVLKFQNLNEYDEYVTLPESEDKDIQVLTESMFKSACTYANKTTFDHLIRTVTDTKKYIDMTMTFAQKLSEKEATAYYRDVLNVDEGNHEALLHIFIAENGYDKDKVFKSCLQKNNSEIEEALFSYGCNRPACEYLFSLCLESIRKHPEDACTVFDFLLTMIPETFNFAFVSYINTFIEELFKNRKLKYIEKYNETLLTIDPYDHGAHFNKVLLKYNYHNPLQLLLLKEKLIDDEDYIAAISSYSEKKPQSQNLYMDIYDTLKQYFTRRIPHKNHILNTCYVPKNDLRFLDLDSIIRDTSQNQTEVEIEVESETNQKIKGLPDLCVIITLVILAGLNLLHAPVYLQFILSTIAIILFHVLFKNYSDPKQLKLSKIFSCMMILCIIIFVPQYSHNYFLNLIEKINGEDIVEAYNVAGLLDPFALHLSLWTVFIAIGAIVKCIKSRVNTAMPLWLCSFILIYALIMDSSLGFLIFSGILELGSEFEFLALFIQLLCIGLPYLLYVYICKFFIKRFKKRNKRNF